MDRLVLIIVFYWVLLFENGTSLLGTLVDIGNGLEIRFTLLLKVLFLFVNLAILVKLKDKARIPIPLLLASVFLLGSTSYTYFINPAHFVRALSVNFHIQLMLNIALYVYLNTKSLKQVDLFLKALDFFARTNAVLVIISFLVPDLIRFFEAGSSSSGVFRAFGIMGDEVSLFTTFFLYKAVVKKEKFDILLYTIALICTGGLGATLVAVAAIAYYYTFLQRLTLAYLRTIILVLCASSVIIAVSLPQLKEIGVIKRAIVSIANPKKENGSLRVISLSAAYEMIKQRPIAGYGYGAYTPAVKDRYAPILKKAGLGWKVPSALVILGSAFNPYIQMVCEAGIIGLLLFILFLAWMYKSFKKVTDSKNPSVALFGKICSSYFLVFCFTVLSANWLLPSSFIFLLLMTLLGLSLKQAKLNAG